MKIDKERVKKSFSDSAKHYDRHADLQHEVMSKLFGRVSVQPKWVLDVGSGTGTLVGLLAEKYPEADVVGLDIAIGMLEVALAKNYKNNVRFLQGDGEALPFDSGQFDLVVSSLALQWMDPEKVFIEAARVLKPGGSFYFSTFGPKTLAELKQAGLSVNDFPAENELKRVLSHQFAGVELKAELLTRNYKDIFELFHYLKEIGAQNPWDVGRKGLTSRRKLAKMFVPENKGLDVSYEVYFGSCLVKEAVI
ncbi:MAG: methyltransferase domain-containing protein [Candidatus Margulisbacteria bacterium]|nr:methyltransferase domain-containing protein [Candidatus Margulisiibacteriota bacterium]